jgi:hypothetical protein
MAAAAERDHSSGLLGKILAEVKRDEYLLWAQLADAGYQWEFQALFTSDGLLTDATEALSRYGWAWLLPGYPDKWISLSKVRNGRLRLDRDLDKGYVLGKIRTRGYVSTRGGNTQATGMSIFPVPGAARVIVASVDQEAYQDR